MDRNRLQRDWDIRRDQLQALTDRALFENRELTADENQQVTLIRSEMSVIENELAEPNTRPPATAPYVDQVLARGANSAPGAQPRNPWGTGDQVDSIFRVAEEVVEAVAAGQSIRRAITLPVGWVNGGSTQGDPLDVTDLAAFFTIVGVDGTTVDTLRFDATDGQVVAEGAPKPDIVTGTLVPGPVQKVAGMAIITTEGLTFVSGAQAAIMNVLRGAIIAGQNTEIMQAVEAGGTDQAFATDALTSVLTAIAMINTRAQASVVIANPADYVGISLDLAKLPQAVAVPQVVVSEDATAGLVTVAARSGVQVARTPVGLLVDPFTLAHENKTRIVSEMFVSASVVRPNVVINADVAGP